MSPHLAIPYLSNHHHTVPHFETTLIACSSTPPHAMPRNVFSAREPPPTPRVVNRHGHRVPPNRTPKKHHGFTGLIILFGFLFPPLAVAARFGIGKDFFINLILTICGYFPGHGHNFFIQNIRDNRNKNRTPKWAVRYGLVDDSHVKKQQKKRQWVGRYNDQAPTRVMYDEDGNEITYDRNHRFEDGDDPNPRRERTQDTTLTVQDQYYNSSVDDDGRSGRSDPSDPYSLRRTGTNASTHSLGATSTNQRSKSRSRGFLGRKKADRHAKAGEVMGDPDRHSTRRGGYGDADSLDDGRYSMGAEGPEDADARYRPYRQTSRQGSSSSYSIPDDKRLPGVPPARSTGGDGLDHVF